MVDYRQAWKVRMIQMIVINAIFAVVGMTTAISEGKPLEGLIIWFFGSWIVETLISSFGKTGDKVSTLARSVVVVMFAGTGGASSGGVGAAGWAFLFIFACVKAMFAIIAIAVILAFEFVAFPITSIYYFIRSRQ